MKKNNSELDTAAQAVIKKLDKNSSSFVPDQEKKRTIFLSMDKIDHNSSLQTPLINYNLIGDKDEFENTIQLIQKLKNKGERDEAFRQLNNRREIDKNLAVLLWHSVGTIAIILQEIIMIYPFLSNTTFSQARSDKISNVLGLFQCLALDCKTRMLFLKSKVKSQSSLVRFSFYKFFKQAKIL